MSIVAKLKRELSSLRNDNPKRNPYILLYKRVRDIAWRLFNAKWRLRKCKKGKLVTLRGRPRIDCNGEIVLGQRVKIWSHIHKTQLSAGGKAKIIIGDHTFINTGTVISSRHQVTIGKNCQIATGVIIMDSDFHGVGDGRNQIEKSTPITIEDNVWLATRAIILKGVKIGEGSTVATGAVVTKDVPPYTIVAGVPAKVIKKIPHPNTQNSKSVQSPVEEDVHLSA